ncbi:MAG: hypothetical protein GEU92_05370 [Alphaproteobacteria bacterium]|nr:hypothetical protein [Alphaproteobacteria bacterium]
MKRPAPVPFLHVFGIPVLVALISIVGLVAALLGDGPMDAISWIGLLVPLLLILWALRYRRR